MRRDYGDLLMTPLVSGFLPVQSIYSDFYVVDDCWPDFKPEHFDSALNWYKDQDVTLGG